MCFLIYGEYTYILPSQKLKLLQDIIGFERIIFKDEKYKEYLQKKLEKLT